MHYTIVAISRTNKKAALKVALKAAFVCCSFSTLPWLKQIIFQTAVHEILNGWDSVDLHGCQNQLVKISLSKSACQNQLVLAFQTAVHEIPNGWDSVDLHGCQNQLVKISLSKSACQNQLVLAFQTAVHEIPNGWDSVDLHGCQNQLVKISLSLHSRLLSTKFRMVGIQLICMVVQISIRFSRHFCFSSVQQSYLPVISSPFIQVAHSYSNIT